METSEQEHVAVDVTASFKPAAKGRTQRTERPSESDVPQRPPSCRKVLLDWTQHPPRSPRSRSRPYSSLHPPALRSAEFAATDPTWSAASPTAPAHFTTLSGPRQCQRLCPRRSNSDPHPAAECRLAQLRQAQVRSRVMIELVEIHPVMAGRWSTACRDPSGSADVRMPSSVISLVVLDVLLNRVRAYTGYGLGDVEPAGL